MQMIGRPEEGIRLWEGTGQNMSEREGDSKKKTIEDEKWADPFAHYRIVTRAFTRRPMRPRRTALID